MEGDRGSQRKPMNYQHQEMLDPDLYDDAFVASFVANLHEPEIDSMSDFAANHFEMMPLDNISSLIELLSENAKERILSTGTQPPEFAVFPEEDHKIKLELDFDIPTTEERIQNFLHAGKALAFTQRAHCIFFSTMQPVNETTPVFGSDVKEDSSWGLYIIGSSLRGNCFTQLTSIQKQDERISFKVETQQITRERQSHSYPYSRFFHLKDSDEMNSVIKQFPKLMNRCNISEKDCVVNFATTLKTLKRFGYLS